MNSLYIDNDEDLIEKLKEKRKIVFQEYMDLDEKDYIPAEDFFFMLETPDMYYTPKEFIKSAKKYPKEFLEYITTPTKIYEHDEYDCINLQKQSTVNTSYKRNCINPPPIYLNTEIYISKIDNSLSEEKKQSKKIHEKLEEDSEQDCEENYEEDCEEDY